MRGDPPGPSEGQHVRIPALSTLIPTHRREEPLMSTVCVFPFSIFDPVHLGLDENGEHVSVNLAERNILVGGEPGAGKSSALNLITAHGALSCDCKLVLIDGKLVELGAWRHCDDMFIGPSMADALACLARLQQIMNDRYDKLLSTGRRKITQEAGEP